MTLAYDNGINLFDTAEVYAAGKYVSFLVGKSHTGPGSPGESLWLCFPGRFTPPTLPTFLSSEWPEGALFSWGQNRSTRRHWSLAKLPMCPRTEMTSAPPVPKKLRGAMIKLSCRALLPCP